MIKYQITQEKLAEIAENVFQERINSVKSGKAIKRRYKPSTIKRRRRFGLSTSAVNLTGSQSYDGKSWRTLDSWEIRPKGNKKVVAVWNKQEAANIYEFQRRRYGDFLRKKQ